MTSEVRIKCALAQLRTDKREEKKKMQVKPMTNPDDPNDPTVNTNDFVIDQNMNPLYNGQPLDVLAWLKANAGDTTQVIISRNGAATGTFPGSLQYASVYIENFSLIYPDLQPAD